MSSDSIARYSFLPWLRQGIANKMRSAEGLRATIPIEIKVTTDDAAVSATVTQEVQLIGPGDITGLNSDAIIRVEPRNWITDFEPNYFPFVEFYEEDLLWRHTPQVPGDVENRLTPWMALVVLKEGEFEDYTGSTSAPLTAIRVANAAGFFPPYDQLFAWAHVHVNEDLTGDGARAESEAVSYLSGQLEANPDLAYCRLLCPRKLEANTPYHAFVIPSFEIGRKAGLGIDLDESTDSATEAAWGTQDQDTFPVYHRWYFRTGSAGDFEYLVRQLEPRAMPPEVGIRDMDVQEPGAGLNGIDVADGVLGLEGALISPQAVRTEWPAGPDPDAWQEEMAERINLTQSYQEEGSPDGDPIVTSPLYGRWHALVESLSAGTENWVHELNLDPRQRVPGGFGTRVIQKNQEKYVNEAWNQVGDILEANQQIKRAQLSKFGSFALYGKHVVALGTDACLSLTAPVYKRVLTDRATGNPTGRTTIAYRIASSTLPAAVLSPAFRKVTRPRGPVIRSVDPKGDKKPAGIVSRVSAGEITATPPKTAPENNVSLEYVAEEVGPAGLPEWLTDLLGTSWFRWLPLILVAVLVLLWLLFGFLGAPIVGALAAGLIYFYSRLRKWSEEVRSSTALQEENLTVEAVEALPEAPGFTVVPAGTWVGPLPRAGTDSAEAENFKKALTDLHAVFESVAELEPAPKTALDLSAVRLDVLEAINPRVAISRRTVSRLGLPAGIKAKVLETFKPVMAYPEFSYPMYVPLRNISAELLVPNVNQVKQNSISLLETNQKFIEAYMVGLNHEMGRELLWREYPTDQRGSYFRQFWDMSDTVNTDETLTEEDLEEKLKDIPPIHEWSKSSNLGDHNNREAQGDEAQLVLVIRGDLLKRYPNTVIYAHRAEWQRDEQRNIDKTKARTLSTADGAERYPLYSAKIEPDITFLGFDLTAEEVKGGTGDEGDEDPGWYFVIKERPGEPRFGLDMESEDTPATEWDDLAWSHVSVVNEHAYIDDEVKANVPRDDNPEDVTWGADSQAHDIAYITYQDPVLVAVHAAKMLA